MGLETDIYINAAEYKVQNKPHVYDKLILDPGATMA